MGDFSTTMNALRLFIGCSERHADPKKHIHVAWLHRRGFVELSQRKRGTRQMLADYIPVIVIITKARSDRGFSCQTAQLLPLAQNVSALLLEEEFNMVILFIHNGA